MSHRIDHLAIACLAAVGVALLSYPAGAMCGGGDWGGSTSGPQKPKKTPAERAERSYEEGERARERALAYEEKARKSDEKGFLGLGARPSEKAQKQWRKAADAFREAATTSRRYSRAYADVCVAHLALGEPEKALAAADRALEKHYQHAPAIACRGETLLELGRLAEAREAWEALKSRDQALADALLQSMRAWLDRNEREPAAEVPGESLEEFRVWMSERGGLASR